MNKYTKYKLELVKEETTANEYNYQVTNPRDIADFLSEVCRLDRSPIENFITIGLNAKGQVIGWVTTSIGDLNSTIIHPRNVFQFAMLLNCASIIVAHNHPSGNPKPSDQDIETTKRLMKAGELLGISLLDSIIVGDNDYISCRREGLM